MKGGTIVGFEPYVLTRNYLCPQELGINNTQYAVLNGSKDFMVTVLMLFTGIVTDRIGGAGTYNPFIRH